jgi:hypothetical protein
MKIETSSINSTAIRNAATSDTVTLLGEFGSGDSLVKIYDLGFARVAETNADPVWEESDPQGFAELLEQI